MILNFHQLRIHRNSDWTIHHLGNEQHAYCLVKANENLGSLYIWWREYLTSTPVGSKESRCSLKTDEPFLIILPRRWRWIWKKLYDYHFYEAVLLPSALANNVKPPVISFFDTDKRLVDNKDTNKKPEGFQYDSSLLNMYSVASIPSSIFDDHGMESVSGLATCRQVNYGYYQKSCIWR